ncbi:replicative helicase loader/inhibitor [Halobacillus salinus]|uniref:Uncharacterized protein n=1 Tax=Halobacillus salinus TaxID=192814 RepID=A0A4Z0H2T2_9BACI|nr:replicative helicase loader/inhibitor [Halobacillus salinus]TGB04708.1 hypothetical protein E4663_06880 [Halobacillus salinus]
MDKKQVLQVFKVIQSVYPRFMPEDTQEQQNKLDTWALMMKDMDYERVMKRTQEHVVGNKFPPTIAEISAYPTEKNKSIEKMNQWKREAEQVPQETKDRFQRELQKLVEAMSDDQ